MRQRWQELGLRLVGHLPRWLRRMLVHLYAPSYSVGAMCVVERDDGARLFVRHSYRGGWGVPGGLLKRGEEVIDACRRETLEETGLEVELEGRPMVVVDPGPRRVDVIFKGRPADPAHVELSTKSPEIVEAKWFPATEMPELQRETAQAIRTLDTASEA